MRHYPYEYALWYDLAQAMKCDIYLKLCSYAQNCLTCTLRPLFCEKKFGIRYGAHKPARVCCSHCHVDDVMNDIILCSCAGFVLNVCLLNCCGNVLIWQWTLFEILKFLKSESMLVVKGIPGCVSCCLQSRSLHEYNLMQNIVMDSI